MRTIFLNSCILGILCYFVFHAIYGERGAIAYFSLSKNLELSLAKLDELRIERLAIEHKVNLLKSGTLDSDFLDEEARRTLGYAKPYEEIIRIERDER